MSKVFGYPEYDEKGEKILTTYDNEYKAMMMDIRVYRMKAGETRTFLREGEETAVLLLSGNIIYKWNGSEATATRKDVFTEGPWCVHGCTGTEITVVANADTVADYVCREWVDEVFVNLPDDAPYPEMLLNQLTEMGAVVHMKLAKTSNLIGEKKFVERLGIYTVLTTSINYVTAKQLFMKRALDILGGLVGCLITLILTVILGPLIYIQSPGPIFFSQVRVGKNGKKFKIYKFRSMYMDAEERKKELMKQNRVKDGMMFKLEWDPRIIGTKKLPDGTIKKGIGNIIRDFSLDEFPQFFNVLKGDMSLVGTRPPTVDEWDKYDLHHRARLATKPGITGMWQVSGRSNITDFEDVVKLDRQYIAEWNFALDIKILFKTVLVVFKRDGAM